MRRRRHTNCSWMGVVLVGLTQAFAGVASSQVISEFPLPVGTPVTGMNFYQYAHSMCAGPDGNIWLLDAGRSSVLRVTPNGQVAEFVRASGVLRGGITPGPGGALWFTEGGLIRRMAVDGTVTGQFPLVYGAFAEGIAAGPDGNLWFTELQHTFVGMPPWRIAIGRVTPGGVLTEYPLTPQQSAGAIIPGPDSSMWFVWAPLGKATLQGVISAVGAPGIAPSSITPGPDGNVWFTDATNNTVGRVSVAGVVTTFLLPTSHSTPFDIVAGPDGNLWFTEYDGNKLGRVTTSGVITEFAVPTPGSNPAAICLGPDGNIWFTESSASQVGRLVLSGPASGNITLTVPAAASEEGANGSFFHTDLWLLNRSFTANTIATLTYRCATGLSCPGNVQAVSLAPRQATMRTDVIGQTFSAPGTNGAIEISWTSSTGPVSAESRVSTPLPPAPAFGTTVPALPITETRTRAVFIGVASGGGLTSGSRSNAGAYNPQPVPADVTFTLHAGDGTILGTYSRSYSAREAYQLSPNIFDLLGVGGTVTADAYLVVTASAPIFPYVTVVDNVSGDSSFLNASADEPTP